MQHSDDPFSLLSFPPPSLHLNSLHISYRRVYLKKGVCKKRCMYNKAFNEPFTTHVTGMNACVSCGKLQEAASLLSAMREAGHEPDSQAFNILIKGYARGGRRDLMEGAMLQMRDAGVPFTTTTYNTAMHAHAREGDMGKVGDCTWSTAFWCVLCVAVVYFVWFTLGCLPSVLLAKVPPVLSIHLPLWLC